MDLSHNLIKFKALNRSIGFGVCVCVVGVCFTLRCSMREEQRALPLVCGACGCPPANPHIHSGSYFVRHLQPRSSSNNSPHPVIASLIRSRRRETSTGVGGGESDPTPSPHPTPPSQETHTGASTPDRVACVRRRATLRRRC